MQVRIRGSPRKNVERARRVVPRVARDVDKPKSLAMLARSLVGLVQDANQGTSNVDLTLIFNACRHESRASGTFFATFMANQPRLTERISNELHTLRSTEESSHKTPTPHDLSQHIGDEAVALGIDPRLSNVAVLDQEEDSIDWDYGVGGVKIKAHDAIELIEKYVVS